MDKTLKQASLEYRTNKKAKGWKYFAYLLPPDVCDKMKEYKRQLMAEHWLKEAQSKGGQ